MNLYFLILMVLPFVGFASEADEYVLLIDHIAFNDDLEAHIFLNNSYEFVATLSEDVELPPGTQVDISAYPFEKDTYRIWTRSRGLFMESATWTQASITDNTLEKLPRITNVEADDGWILSTYYVELDDGSKWYTRSKKTFGENYVHWEIGDRVIVSKLGGSSEHSLVNVDAPYRLDKWVQDVGIRTFAFIVDTRCYTFTRVIE